MYPCAIHRSKSLISEHEISEHEGSFFVGRLSRAVADNRAALGVLDR
jgi:hypothetical protein